MEKYEPPKPTLRDKACALVESAASLVPVPYLGESVSILTELIGPPIRKREMEWREEVGKGLRELEASQLCVFEQLQENNVFIDTLIRALQAARCTGNRKKREALRNAVLNAASPQAPDEVIQAIFIGLIAEFTEYHLVILQRLSLNNRNAYEGIASGLSERESIIRSIVGDLEDHQLINVVGRSAMGERGVVVVDGLSELGTKFLSFIASPIQDS